MNNFLIRFVCVCSMFIISNLALADEGGYIEGSLGWGKVNLKGAGSNTGLAGGGAIGYLYNENIGVEVNGYFFSNVERSTKDNRVFSLALKGILPLSPEFDVFGKAGIGVSHIKSTANQFIEDTRLDDGDTKNRFTGFFALGLQYNIDSQIGIHVQGITTNTNEPVPAMFGALAGLTLRF